MVGRPKKNNDIEEIKIKTYFSKSVMEKLLQSGKLENSYSKQLEKWDSKSKKDDNKPKDYYYVEEIYFRKKTKYGRLQGKIKYTTKEDYNFTVANMTNVSRNLLFRDNYWDVDFVNCHFIIALHLFKKHNLPHDKIEYYINNREKCLEEVIEKSGGDEYCSRYSAKALFLRICYGGKIKNWCVDTLSDAGEFMTGFYKELEDQIHSNIIQLIDNTDEYYRNVKAYAQGIKDAKEDNRSIYTATFSYICQDLERKCLLRMKECFEKNNYIVGGLIYDGLHVWKPVKDNERLEIPEFIINTVEKYIEETEKIPMKITIKSMYNEEDDDYLIPCKKIVDMHEEAQKKEYSQVKNNFEQKIFKCTNTGDFYEEQVDHLEGTKKYIRRDKKSLTTAYEHLIYLEIFKGKEGIKYEKQEFLKRWFKDENIRNYEEVIFEPPSVYLKENKNVFNTWVGFKAEKYKFKWECDNRLNKIKGTPNEELINKILHPINDSTNCNQNSLELCKDEELKTVLNEIINLKTKEEEPFLYNLEIILNHLKFISGGYNFLGTTKDVNEKDNCLQLIENEEKENYEYIIKWISHIIQYPSIKPNVMLIIRSVKQGIGKSFFYHILTSLLGSNLCCKIDNIERDMFGSFNSPLENALLVFTDEIDKKIWSKHRDNFYNFITEDTTMINQKGLKQKKTQSYRRFVATSNKDEPIVVEKECRRTFVVDIKTNYKPSSYYFDNLLKILKCEKTLKIFFNYLKNYDLKNFNPERNKPITQFQEGLKEVQTDPLILFLKDKCYNCGFKYGVIEEVGTEQSPIRNINCNQKHLSTSLKLDYISYMNDNYTRDFKIQDNVFSKKIKDYKFNGIFHYTPGNKTTFIFLHKIFYEDLYNRKYIKKEEYDHLILAVCDKIDDEGKIKPLDCSPDLNTEKKDDTSDDGSGIDPSDDDDAALG